MTWAKLLISFGFDRPSLQNAIFPKGLKVNGADLKADYSRRGSSGSDVAQYANTKNIYEEHMCEYVCFCSEYSLIVLLL